MDWHDRLRATIISTITRDISRGFWEDARPMLKQTYADVFEGVKADPNLIDEQRLEFLYQQRHFRMEHALVALSRDYGLAWSATILADNNCHYAYVTGGSIGMTQAYVPAIGSMPRVARFRERLAAMSGIPRTPRLDLGIEPGEVMIGKDYYGIIVHNPVGKRFNEAEQRLGMIQICFPTKDCKAWAVQLTMDEIIAEYPAEKRESQPDRKPEWKRKDKKGRDAS